MSIGHWVIHIGLHKTGTSAVQHCLAGARATLLQAGVLFPETGFGTLKHPTSASASQGHNGFAHAVRDGDERRFGNLVQRLEAEAAQAGARAVILSSEIFSAPACAAAPDWWRRHIPATARVDVISFLRRQDHWIESYYKELLGWARVRETRDISTFVAEEGPALLDYAARLAPWQRTFGRQALRVLSYDDAVAGSGVMPAMLESAGLGALAAQLPAAPAGNPSLDGGLVDLLLACNRELELERGAKKKLTALLLSVRLQPGGARCSVLPHALRLELAARYRESNRVLAAELVTGPASGLEFPATVEEVPPCPQVYRGGADLS